MRRTGIVLAGGGLIFLSLFTPQTGSAAITLALEGATVHPVSGPAIEEGVVLVDDAGDIAFVGSRSDAVVGDAEVVDLSGLHLYPGLIAATSSLGLTEIAAVRSTNDVAELGENNARLHAYRAFNPDSELIAVARANGLTHANVVPGGALIRGQSGLLALDGWTWEQRLVRGPTGLHLDWPAMGLDRGPDAPPVKKQLREREERVEALHETLRRARHYLAAVAAGEAVDRDLELEAWGPVLRGELPLMVHADEERQIRSALAFGEDEGLHLVLIGGRDAPRVAAALAAASVPVILERVMTRPGRDTEGVWSGYERAARLADAGVSLAISVGSGPFADSIARNLPFHAGMAHAHGLSADLALRSITLTPAEILGVADRMGSIEAGKRAHLIAVDGDLLEIRSRLLRMWIDGHEVDLSNRQTRLAERYRGRPRP